MRLGTVVDYQIPCSVFYPKVKGRASVMHRGSEERAISAIGLPLTKQSDSFCSPTDGSLARSSCVSMEVAAQEA